MPPNGYRVYQCTQPACRFRFPAPAAAVQARVCPRCGSPLERIDIPAEEAGWRLPQPEPNGPRLSALLDNIRSTYNVGSMFRTADGAGLDGLYLCGTTPTPDHPSLRKTSLGAEFSIPWRYAPNALDLARELIQQGQQLWALEVGSGARSIFEPLEPSPGQPVVLVVGNEVSGVDPDLLPLCERQVWIPMHGYKSSLNVAIAFGVAAYAIRYPREAGETYS
jgi:tRNA G18 (ribose-2'-O)-methylase SpoU